MDSISSVLGVVANGCKSTSSVQLLSWSLCYGIKEMRKATMLLLVHPLSVDKLTSPLSSIFLCLRILADHSPADLLDLPQWWLTPPLAWSTVSPRPTYSCPSLSWVMLQSSLIVISGRMLNVGRIRSWVTVEDVHGVNMVLQFVV